MPGPSERRQFGSYELLAPLAVGGTAEIYLARVVGEAGFEKVVVVKQLLEHLAEDDEFVDMFLDEARLGSHMHHGNIVQTLELGKFAGRFFIVQEYVAGLTLAQTAVKGAQRVPGGLPVDLAVNIVEQACAGLHYAHEAKLSDGTPLKLVHRDVSPQNLVIMFEGVVKIVDFGIAHAAVREARTKAGMIKGKFAYMSPEQCLGKPVDRRTDVFALGVVLWECATGSRLFKRKTTYETYQAIVKGTVTSPSSVNPRVDQVLEAAILKALQYRPEDRYQTAEEMGDALEQWRTRAGKRVSHLDVARFYERYFQPELEEHRARMSTALGEERAADAFANSGSWNGGEDLEPSAPGVSIEISVAEKTPWRGEVPIPVMAANIPTQPIVISPEARRAALAAASAPGLTPTPELALNTPVDPLSQSGITTVMNRPSSAPNAFPLPAPEPTAIGARPVALAVATPSLRAPTPILPVMAEAEAEPPAPAFAPAPVAAAPVIASAVVAVEPERTPGRLDSEPVPPPTVSRGRWVYIALVLLCLGIIAGALLAIRYLL